MRQTRTLTFAAVVALAVLLPAGPAAAAVPANDTPAGAVALEFGDTVTLDTTEATTDKSEDAWFQDCDPKNADATVWYTYTSPTRTGVDIDWFESDYEVGMLVTTGTPGEDLETVLCGGGRFTAEAGVTYTIAIFDDQSDERRGRFGDATGPRVDGGTLQLSVNTSDPVPGADLTVDQEAVLDADGSVTVTGTYSCTEASTSQVFGGIDQTVRGTKVSGFAEEFFEGTCDGTERPWTLVVVPDEGTFKEGKPATTWFAFGCIDEGNYCSGRVVDTKLQIVAA
jgi:opacity protein-like surface antigen